MLAKEIQEGLWASALLLSKDGIILIVKNKERNKRAHQPSALSLANFNKLKAR